MPLVVVSDPLAKQGIQLLQDRGHEVIDITSFDDAARAPHLAAAEAWVIRSGTRITADHFAQAPKLRAVGRAGVGVDNVDLAAATAQGVAVFNSPTGNITSAAEQAWALMLACARRVPEADAGMKQEKWLRKELKGMELAGKTLFLVGLGRIGRMMARRAQAFEMTVLGHDPFVTPEAAAAFDVEWVDLDDGFARSDIVSLHTPATPQTKGMVDAARLAKAKDGLVLINAARGPLVDAEALLAAIDSGKVRFAGLDVWPEEPPTDWSLAKHPRVVAAPHLGASTQEAQVKAAMEAIERMCDFLDSGDAGLAVNAQARVPELLRPWAVLAQALTGFAVQTLDGPLLEVTVCATPELDAKALEMPAVVGALQAAYDTPVNAINAPGLATERGWTVASRALPDDEEQYLRIHLRTKNRELAIEGTYTPHYGPRVTGLDGYDLEFRPDGRFLFTRHKDVPGVLAKVTGLLADAAVNVASVSLARKEADGTAIAVIKVDGSIPQSARDGLRGLEVIHEAHRIRVGDQG